MNAKRQCRTAICLEGWYFLVVMGFVLTAAIIRDINLLMVLFGLMLGGLVFNLRAVLLTLRDVEVRRRLPAMVAAGDILAVELEFRNPRKKRASWAVVVRDEIRHVAPEPHEPSLTPSLLFTHIPPGQVRRLSYQGRFSQRGLYRFGPLRVSTRFPLGLVRRTVTIDAPDRVVVHPRLGRLTSRWLQRQREAEDGAQRQQRPLGVSTGDYHGLRDWRPGDSRRWIHWRTSARRGELMVRQYEQQRNQDLVLILELWSPAEAQEADLQLVENVLSFAATVVDDRCRRGGSRLTLGIAGEQPSVLHGAASPALLQEAMEELAVAMATPHDRLPPLLDEALGALRPGAEVALISTRSVILADTARFAAVWNNTQKQSALSQAMTVDLGGAERSAWFQQGDLA